MRRHSIRIHLFSAFSVIFLVSSLGAFFFSGHVMSVSAAGDCALVCTDQTGTSPMGSCTDHCLKVVRESTATSPSILLFGFVALIGGLFVGRKKEYIGEILRFYSAEIDKLFLRQKLRTVILRN